MRRRVPDASDAVDGVDRPQQVGEPRCVLTGAEVTPVRVHVLSEQGDLRDAVGCQLLDLAQTSPRRRLTSRPRTIGTMQNVHELSQPIWIVTHAECATSRRAGSADG